MDSTEINIKDIIKEYNNDKLEVKDITDLKICIYSKPFNKYWKIGPIFNGIKLSDKPSIFYLKLVNDNPDEVLIYSEHKTNIYYGNFSIKHKTLKNRNDIKDCFKFKFIYVEGEGLWNIKLHNKEKYLSADIRNNITSRGDHKSWELFYIKILSVPNIVFFEFKDEKFLRLFEKSIGSDEIKSNDDIETEIEKVNTKTTKTLLSQTKGTTLTKSFTVQGDMSAEYMGTKIGLTVTYGVTTEEYENFQQGKESEKMSQKKIIFKIKKQCKINYKVLISFYYSNWEAILIYNDEGKNITKNAKGYQIRENLDYKYIIENIK